VLEGCQRWAVSSPSARASKSSRCSFLESPGGKRKTGPRRGGGPFALKTNPYRRTPRDEQQETNSFGVMFLVSASEDAGARRGEPVKDRAGERAGRRAHGLLDDESVSSTSTWRPRGGGPGPGAAPAGGQRLVDMPVQPDEAPAAPSGNHYRPTAAGISLRSSRSRPSRSRCCSPISEWPRRTGPTPRPTTPTRRRSSRRSSAGPGSRSGSTRSSTPARSAASSPAGTTASTATPASA
jgi:hypothetical protein